ncbi:hypothetical protein Cme02nite_12120 [Catellatospora methionotrophica]|uniref:Uncharacterized protein n=1 Tax=Catellatospora methionotrophica TaxID=121620 RepID=A0A8J3LE90_9ACTN|nr:hypothetical protein [Catellatospora methionotrophica]GIG12880.1 hypothetical protein Cme02nite_12120 [Catellatospora methionotrophica]
MTLSTTMLSLYTAAVASVTFSATLFVMRDRLTLVEEARLILDQADEVGEQWWGSDDDPRTARRRAVVAFWRRALDRRRPDGSRRRPAGPAGDPTHQPGAVGQASPVRRPEADPEVTAYLDAVPPYPAVDYHGRHTATGAYPQVPSTRQAYP